jgi:autotransporter-associated beta strand protein
MNRTDSASYLTEKAFVAQVGVRFIRRAFVLLTLTTAALLGGNAMAATSQTWTLAGSTGTWDTSSNNWSTAGSTTGATTWVQNDDATFGGAYTITIGSTTIQADSITDTTGNLTINGGTLQLGTGSNNGGVTLANGNTFTMTINSAVQLTGSQTWDPYGNGGIIIGGNITESGAGGYTLTLNNSGGFNSKSTQLNGTNTFGSLTIQGGNTQTVTLGGSTTLAGNLTLASNTAGDVLNLNAATSVGGNFTVNGADTINIDNASLTGTLNLNAIATLNTSSGGVTLSTTLAQNWNNNLLIFTGTGSLNMGTGAVTLGNNLILNASSATAANVLTIGGVISDGGNGYSFYKDGAGSVTLNGANTYTGGTTIAQGLLTFGNSTAADTGSVTLLAGGVNGSTLAYGYDFTQTDLNKVVSNNAGTTIAEGLATTTQSLNFTNYSNVNFGATVNSTYSGTITAGANGYLLGGGGAILTLSNNNALMGALNVSTFTLDILSGGIAATGGNNITGTGNITVGASNVGGELVFNSSNSLSLSPVIEINGSGVVSLTKGGSGLLGLDGANTYFSGESEISEENS